MSAAGVVPAEPAGPPLSVNDNDPPALQLLTLPVVVQQAANQNTTAGNLEALRTEVY
ncbi:MAG: hypothetical protein ACRDYF_03505 [Acidimicrobiia bacterium]